MIGNKTLHTLQELKSSVGDLSTVLPAGKNLAQSIADGNVGGGGSVSVKQVTKLGINATPENPHSVFIDTEETISFNRLQVNVLKFIPGPSNVVTTVADFTNSEASDFEVTQQVVFDGKMKLQTEYIRDMIDGGVLEDGNIYSLPIDLTEFKKIEKIEVI